MGPNSLKSISTTQGNQKHDKQTNLIMEIIFANKDTHKELTYLDVQPVYAPQHQWKKPSEIGAQGLSGHFPKEDIEVVQGA